MQCVDMVNAHYDAVVSMLTSTVHSVRESRCVLNCIENPFCNFLVHFISYNASKVD